MNTLIPQCPKCRVEMKEGYVLNRDHRHCVSVWISDKPVKKWWGVDARGKEMLEIESYRCPQCGFLESYAGKQTTGENK